MSAAAIPIYNLLIAGGMSEKEARKSAEAAAAEVVEAAKAEAAKIVAQSEDKAKVQFVSKDEYHERDKTLATRAEMDAGFAEVNRRMDAGFAQIRAEMIEIRRAGQNTNRIGVGTLFAIFVLVAHLVVGG